MNKKESGSDVANVLNILLRAGTSSFEIYMLCQ